MAAQTPSPLLPLPRALEALLASVERLPGREDVPLAESLGRVLARDVEAQMDLPPWDNSAMDGYALRSADAGQDLAVVTRVAAGDARCRLPPGTAARIFTGAPLPEGADAVVMQEMARVSVPGDSGPAGSCVPKPNAYGDLRHRQPDGAPRVFVEAPLAAGEHVRRRGEECRRGDCLLEAGRRLRPQDLGLAASQGFATLSVRPRLRVALLSTGSELREPDGNGAVALASGAIYNGNRPMLSALLAVLGCTVVDQGIVEDTPEATRRALTQAAQDADLVLTSGGVSVGEADHVRDAVAELGAIELWRIAIKPGKPFAFGSVAGTPFMGLPGNPSSAFVTFLLLARPWIAARQGRRDMVLPSFEARADFSRERPGTRAEYLRVRLAPEPAEDGAELSSRRSGAGPRSAGPWRWARPYGNQSSGILRSVVDSDGLALVPAGGTVSHGDTVEVIPLDALLA